MKLTLTSVLIVAFIIVGQSVLAQNSISEKESALVLIDKVIEKKMREAGIVGLGAAIIIVKNLSGQKVTDMQTEKIKHLLLRRP